MVTRVALFADDEIVASRTTTTLRQVTVDEVRSILSAFSQSLDGIRTNREDAQLSAPLPGAILSCVVPDVTGIWVEALRDECVQPPLVVGPGLKTGIKMNYSDPAELGSDRIADIVAARAYYKSPLIIVDFGVITTMQAIDANGVFVGGMIAPGLSLGACSLSQTGARLPVIEVKVPRSVLGKTTREAMQSGVVLGEAARIDGLIDMAWRELGYETDIVLAGTNAGLLKTLLVHRAHADETLTLKGLNLLSKMNRRAS
jgi:type III pantothenate kinase